MKQICLGCKEECKMSYPTILKGCVYEDSVYPEDAEIWCPELFIIGAASELNRMADIEEKYPEEWEKEEHNESRS